MTTPHTDSIQSEIDPIGLGTFAMGGSDWKASWGAQDDAVSIATIHKALDEGINWIDTAPVYGYGVSEAVVGQALKDRSEKPFIATKLGRRWTRDRQLISVLDADSVREECEDSLRRLGIDVIDLYQIHWPIPDERIEEAWEVVAELQQAGKIRYAGVSNFSVSQLQRCQAILPIDTLQSPLSLLAAALLDEIVPYCREQGIGILAYSPMQKGLLLGKVSPDWVASLDADDHRKKDPLFQEPRLSQINAQVAEAKILADSLGLTLQQLAVAWVNSVPGVTASIIGCRSPEQAEAAASCNGVSIDAAAKEAVERIFGLQERS